MKQISKAHSSGTHALVIANSSPVNLQVESMTFTGNVTKNPVPVKSCILRITYNSHFTKPMQFLSTF